MVILPIGDENPRVRTPVVHTLLIVVNVAVFVILLTLEPEAQHHIRLHYGLVKSSFQWHQLVTSLFLHSGPVHIFFNMLFLWIVGDNVEDRLGHIGYLFFYSLVGIAGGAAHLVTVSVADAGLPCIGASGAVSGVMAAYVVFFPNARIKIFTLFWWFVNIVYVSAKWAIGFWFAQQLLLWFVFGSASGIAYGAHLGGFLTGLGVAALLKGRLKPYDAVGRILGTGAETDFGWGQPESGWTQPETAWGEQAGWGQSAPEQVAYPPPEAEVIEAESVPARPLHTELVEQLTQAIASGRTDEAMRLYDRITAYSGVPPSAELLLKLGGVMVDHTEYDRAVRVYENYLNRYPQGDQAPEAAFRVGMIRSRRTRDYVGARKRLEQAARDHHNPKRRNRAVDEIRLVDSFLRSTFTGKAQPEGLCTIIRQTDGRINVAGVAEMVVKVTGEPLADASRKLLVSRGIVTENVPAGQAFALADRIQKLGVPVLVVPDRDMAHVDPPDEIRGVHLTQTGIRFDLTGGGQVIRGWDEIELLSVGLLGRSRKVSHTIRHLRQYHSSGRPALSQPRKDEIVTRKEKDFLVVDVFLVSSIPPRHLRGVEGKFRYKTEDGQGSGTRDRQFGRFVNAVFDVAPDLTSTPGAHQEASGVRGPKREYTFQGLQEFDEYNRWLRTLNRYQPARKTRSTGSNAPEAT